MPNGVRNLEPRRPDSGDEGRLQRLAPPRPPRRPHSTGESRSFACSIGIWVNGYTPYPPQVFDTLLGHKVAGIAGVYTRLNPAGGILAEASQATADWIAAAMDGRKPRLGEKFRPDQIPQASGVKEATA
jgi:hypothetical protein